MTGTSCPDSVCTKLDRIAMLARRMPGVALTTLAHHIDADWMHEAYRRTRKDAAPGVDGQTAAEYAANLESNLQALLTRAKDGWSYRAPPVRRVHIPKGDGDKTRPIGIPTFEDKVLQRAVVMVLGAVYEQDFLPCSYGFRPGRSAHQALEALRNAMMRVGGGWVLEVDIESFFDSIDHRKLQELLRWRVRDGVLLRLIGKWLNAGVLFEGCLYHSESGTPQGGVISPLLANVYLHEALDCWFYVTIGSRLAGEAHLVRYADDFVIVFEHEQDAHRVHTALGERLARFGLRLHPEKTRLIDFRKPRRKPPHESFDFLGFTHFWKKSRKGNWVVGQKTAHRRFSRALHSLSQWMRAHRHEPIRVQHRALVPKLRGHYAYYGITGNSPALTSFNHWARRLWRKWLGRRSWKASRSWERMTRVLSIYPFPPPVVVHSVLRAAKR